jgi:glycerophosphoryl diester phosphodiesterase
VEIDVQRLADGELAVHHDLLTSRITNLPNKTVRQIDSATWKSLSLRDRRGNLTDESPALLHEVLPAVEASSKTINVEIKQEYADCDAAHTAVQNLTQQMPSGRWLISAIQREHLRCVRQVNPHTYLGEIVLDKKSMALQDPRTRRLSDHLESPHLGADFLRQIKQQIAPPVGLHIDAYSLSANPLLLEDAHKLGMSIFTYSLLPDAEHAQMLRQAWQAQRRLPTGAIINGDPEQFCAALAQ